MAKLSERQEDLRIKRKQLEDEIMLKIGQPEESQLWINLNNVRQEIDDLSEEKMQLAQKMFNLGVQFCQQLDIQNIEQKKYIQQEQAKM